MASASVGSFPSRVQSKELTKSIDLYDRVDPISGLYLK